MSKHASEILTMQKLVFLLNDFHFTKFSKHLSSIHAALPGKLIALIRDKLPNFHTPDELCLEVYGSCDEADKKKFNQLSSHTLRLTEFLAVNYPCYLHPNIFTIQELANTGKWEDAIFLAEVLLSFADKVDDFKAQLLCCKFLAERAFSIRDYTTGFRYDTRTQEALELERVCTSMQSKVRHALYQEKKTDANQLNALKEELKQYHASDKNSLRILSLFYYLRLVFYYELRQFGSAEFLPIIEKLNKELHLHPYVILPFMIDIKGMLLFMQLNSSLYAIESKERKKLFEELKEHYRYKKASGGSLNTTELHLLAVQGTHFLSKYHHQIGLKNYADLMPAEERRELNELIEKLQAYLALPEGSQLPDFQIRSLRMLLGVMLIISGGKNIKLGIQELESMLVAYQQVNLGASTDSIFLSLMVGYLAIGDFDSCVTTFKRFAKIKPGKILYVGNELKIQAYYYLAQYLQTGKKQYIEKMREALSATDRSDWPKTVVELYSNIGVEL
jgi:hypothetical protein